MRGSQEEGPLVEPIQWEMIHQTAFGTLHCMLSDFALSFALLMNPKNFLYTLHLYYFYPFCTIWTQSNHFDPDCCAPELALALVILFHREKTWRTHSITLLCSIDIVYIHTCVPIVSHNFPNHCKQVYIACAHPVSSK